ncbi:hypothetical protein AMTR_s00003p00222870 [Amborella trichopoda]|uniref:Fe2OG dioxygenase domain-containing protein n=1 Tax=Amborella trichopoda TaxID=13333 RepID=W1P0D7_AMBTC|nr:hypothetical protein AMTR_s00003p00222870 [Amborella trichopoda]
MIYQNTINTWFLRSHAAKEYITAVRDLACQILDLIEEGLGLCDTKLLSSLLRDCESDSVFRLNHYPPCRDLSAPSPRYAIGFGEHSDPQILTILHSNETPGLQISLQDENWITIPPDPTSFCVNVGDALQHGGKGRHRQPKGWMVMEGVWDLHWK